MAIDVPTLCLLGLLNACAVLTVLMFEPAVSEPRFKSLVLPILGGFGLFMCAHFITNTFATKNQLVQFLASITIPINIGAVVPNSLLMLRYPKITDNAHAELVLTILGVAIRIFGTMLLIWTVYLFAQRGNGTLSPAPELQTKTLVVQGPYSHIRNPMITGVLMELLGIAMINLSLPMALFTLMFFAVKTAWFIYFEEPDMEKRFGRSYREYRKKIGRWVPSIRPYSSCSEDES
jgi:protein-S-isoprenylcysteine O-methyltransferase Ste14